MFTVRLLRTQRLAIGTLGAAAALALALALIASPAAAADISWANALGGNWNTGANWSGGSPPGASDNAIITLAGTYTVTLDVNATVAGLTLGGATGVQTLLASNRTLTLNGASTIAPNGRLDLRASTVAGSGTLDNQGTLICGAGRTA